MHFIRFGFQPLEPAPDAVVVLIAFHDGLLLLRAERLPGHIGRNVILLAKGKQLAPLPLRRFDPPGLDGSQFQRQGRVGDDQLRVNINRAPKPAAGLTRAERAVEREHIRHRLLIGNAARRALKLVRERYGLIIFVGKNQRQAALAILKGLLK